MKRFYGVVAVVALLGTAWIGAQIFRGRSQTRSLSSAQGMRPATMAERIGVVKGKADASVLVVEFSDFSCPFCARFATEVFPVLDSLYVRTGKVRWVFVDFPLPIHPNAPMAAELARCALDQGLFWPVHDAFFAHSREWSFQKKDEALSTLLRLAAEAGADTAALQGCYVSGEYRELVRENTQYALALGIRVTPSFVINGQVLKEGFLSVEEFRSLLEDFLSEQTP